LPSSFARLTASTKAKTTLAAAATADAMDIASKKRTVCQRNKGMILAKQAMSKLDKKSRADTLYNVAKTSTAPPLAIFA
jgi:hypothetical protein